MLNKQIVIDIKSLLLVSIVKLIIIGTCTSGTIYIMCNSTNWVNFPAAYFATNMGLMGQLLLVLPMLVSQLSEMRTVFLVIVCNSCGIATNIFAVVSIYNIEDLDVEMILLDHHIAVAVLSVIDLGLLTLTIHEGIFNKPITFADREVEDEI